MKILIIVEPERKDWYHYLKKDTSNDFFLLWHESFSDIPNWIKEEPFFKKIYYWDAYISPSQLLREINPDRIVFFEIIDQRQIALLVTANKKNIKTFYLEHGAAGNKETAIKRANVKNFFLKSKRSYLLNRFKNSLGRMIKSKIFYYSSMFKLLSFNSWVKYCRLPFSMLFDTPNKALANCLFPERVPHRAIVFNRPNFEQFQVYTGLTEDKAVFSGVPIFDNYYSQVDVIGSHISYIDHPYLEAKILNWTPDYHRKIATKLYTFALSRQIKILVKLHPSSDISLWKSYKFDSPLFEIVQEGDYTKQLLESQLILAYSSSLVNGFLCAKRNVVLLGWHPEAGIFGADFSKTGLCHLSLSPNDLDQSFDYWITRNFSKANEMQYQNFLAEFNNPFDGKAAERVRMAITDDEIY